MRYSALLLLFAAVLSTGCGSQRNTGAALVTAGALTAAIGASAASGSQCTSFGCYPQRPSATGAKVALAGLATAAAGYALVQGAPQDRVPSPAPASPPSSSWRLVRSDPIAPDPAADPAPEEEPEEKTP